MSAATINLEAPVFWAVECPSYLFRVSELMARHVQAQLLNGIVEFVQFTDACGSPCVYRRDRILGLWRSTPASRELDRALTQAIAAETPPGIPGTDGS